MNILQNLKEIFSKTIGRICRMKIRYFPDWGGGGISPTNRQGVINQSLRRYPSHFFLTTSRRYQVRR